MRRETAPEQNRGDYHNRERKIKGMQERQAAQDVPELRQRAMRLDADAEHIGQHGHADLDADASEEADERRAR